MNARNLVIVSAALVTLAAAPAMAFQKVGPGPWSPKAPGIAVVATPVVQAVAQKEYFHVTVKYSSAHAGPGPWSVKATGLYK